MAEEPKRSARGRYIIRSVFIIYGQRSAIVDRQLDKRAGTYWNVCTWQSESQVRIANFKVQSSLVLALSHLLPLSLFSLPSLGHSQAFYKLSILSKSKTPKPSCARLTPPQRHIIRFYLVARVCLTIQWIVSPE